MDYAAIIKDRVSTPELFEFYGFHRNRSGFVQCMFHQDNHASMKIYDGARGYHCFSCKATGDVLDFVQRYFGVSFWDAILKINEDFGLCLPVHESYRSENRSLINLESEILRARRNAEQRAHDEALSAYDRALSAWIRLDRKRIEYAPKSPSDPLNEIYVYALHNIDRAAHVLDEAQESLYILESKRKRAEASKNRVPKCG